MNETVRRWIVAEGCYPAHAKTWAKVEPGQAWGKGRQVMALLGALGLFLYTIQHQDFQYLMECITALFAGIPIIAEWLGQPPKGNRPQQTRPKVSCLQPPPHAKLDGSRRRVENRTLL